MHPNYLYNDNKVDSFAEKVSNAENFILKKLGMPVGIDFHRKFTVRNPEGKFFKYLVKAFGCVQVKLTDVIFTNTGDDIFDNEIVYYIRQRVKTYFLINF